MFKSVIKYLAIVFGISWLIALGIYLGGGLGSMAALGLYPYMLVPAFGAFIMRKFVTKEGFRNSGLRFGKPRYYLYAWLILVGIIGLAYLLTVLFGLCNWDLGLSKLPEQIWQSLPEGFSPLLLFGIIFFANTMAKYGEFLVRKRKLRRGWRSYLLPKLLPLGRLRALILHGAIWGLWHVPIILMGHNYPGYPLLGVFLMIIFYILARIILGWLYFASSSVFVSAFAHGVMNNTASALILIVTLFNPTLGGITGAIGLGILFLTVLILYWTKALNKIDIKNLLVEKRRSE